MTHRLLLPSDVIVSKLREVILPLSSVMVMFVPILCLDAFQRGVLIPWYGLKSLPH